jgi:hypothetical protein
MIHKLFEGKELKTVFICDSVECIASWIEQIYTLLSALQNRDWILEVGTIGFLGLVVLFSFIYGYY